MDAPKGLFSKGFLFGIALLFLAGVVQSRVSASAMNAVYPVLFPTPVVRMGKDLAANALAKSCQTFLRGTYEYVDGEPVYFCEGAPNASKMIEIATKTWFYVLIGTYYGILSSVLVRLYVFARNRMEW